MPKDFVDGGVREFPGASSHPRNRAASVDVTSGRRTSDDISWQSDSVTNRADQGGDSCPHDDGGFIGVCRERPPERPPRVPHGDHGERI